MFLSCLPPSRGYDLLLHGTLGTGEVWPLGRGTLGTGEVWPLGRGSTWEDQARLWEPGDRSGEALSFQRCKKADARCDPLRSFC